MRQLKHHEKKLLKKVDFLQWKSDATIHQADVMRRYHIQNRDDYSKYNKLCGEIRKIANKLTLLEDRDPFRTEQTEKLLLKLERMGLIPAAQKLSQCEKITVAAFCRRRLPIIMVRLKMTQTVREAVTLVEQGHVRVGPDVMNDPAFLVTRAMEDFVTWTESSKIKRKIMKYHDKLDDFDLLQ